VPSRTPHLGSRATKATLAGALLLVGMVGFGAYVAEWWALAVPLAGAAAAVVPVVATTDPCSGDCEGYWPSVVILFGIALAAAIPVAFGVVLGMTARAPRRDA
jgi:hypothetical protein